MSEKERAEIFGVKLSERRRAILRAIAQAQIAINQQSSGQLLLQSLSNCSIVQHSVAVCAENSTSTYLQLLRVTWSDLWDVAWFWIRGNSCWFNQAPIEATLEGNIKPATSLKNPDLWGASVWRFKMQAAYLWMWVREFKCVRLNLNAGYPLQLEEQTTWWDDDEGPVEASDYWRGRAKVGLISDPLKEVWCTSLGPGRRRGARYCAQPPLWPGDGASCSKSNLLLCGSSGLLKAA